MIPFPLILGGGALAAYFLFRKKPASSTSGKGGGGNKVTYCASVNATLDPSLVQSVMIPWMNKWAPRAQEPALPAVFELFSTLYPQCRWDEGTTTIILRAQAPKQVPFQQIVTALRGHTLAEADAVLAASLGQQSATPGVAPDGLAKLLGVR